MNNGHTCNSLTPVNEFVSIQFRIPGDLRVFRCGKLRQQNKMQWIYALRADLSANPEACS